MGGAGLQRGGTPRQRTISNDVPYLSTIRGKRGGAARMLTP
jgi:hypothetical protein